MKNLYNLFFYSNQNLSFDQIFSNIVSDLLSEDFQIYELNKLDIFNIPIRNYVYSLFLFVKYLISFIKTNCKFWESLEINKLDFGLNTAQNILNYLKKKFNGLNFRFLFRFDSSTHNIIRFPKEFREVLFNFIYFKYKSLDIFNIKFIIKSLINGFIKEQYREIYYLFILEDYKSTLIDYIKNLIILSQFILEILNTGPQFNKNEIMEQINNKKIEFLFGSFTIYHTISYFKERFYSSHNPKL